MNKLSLASSAPLLLLLGSPAASAQGGGLRDSMPDTLRGPTWVGVEYWQIIGLLVVIVLSVMADFIARLLAKPFLGRLAKRFFAEALEDSLPRLVRPVGLAVGALVYLVLLRFLDLDGRPDVALAAAGKIVTVAALVWASWSATNLIAQGLLERARKTDTPFDDMLIPLGRRSVKLFIIALGTIYLASSLEIDLLPLLASFSIAGLAVSFAAQDTIKNLFGGLTIFLDRPFHLGERVLFKGHDGIIESIGFRTVKLRSLTGNLVTIPNGLFTSEPVENPSRRPTIRRTLDVTIPYDTPREKIEGAVEILRGILEEEGIREPIHPVIDGNELAPRVYFNELNAESLNLFVIYWFAPPAYWDYLEHAQKLNLRILEEFEKAGLELAFPTRTVYLAEDPKRKLSLEVLEAER